MNASQRAQCAFQSLEKQIFGILSDALAGLDIKIAVLDDDPTGTQTVHGIQVLADYGYEAIREAFGRDEKLFYVLTNSRSLCEKDTRELHVRLTQDIFRAGRETGHDFLIISRADSTLRGHWPLETRCIMDELGRLGAPVDGEVIFPFFGEGGRLTAGDVHYVRQGDALVPAGETEFAKDTTFGYTASNLKDWVQEKSGILRETVDSVSLEALRGDIPGVTQQLLALEGVMVVNALDYTDVAAFCIALADAIAAGKRYVFRTAASFVRVFGGITPKPLLGKQELTCPGGAGGLVVVGSHVQKSTEQLHELLTLEQVDGVEFDASLVLQDEDAVQGEVTRTARRCNEIIASGRIAVLYTKRQLLRAQSNEASLELSMRVANGLTRAVKAITVKPAFIIAKGGITSSEIVTQSLSAKKALVLGQADKGIPVWQLGEESRFPGLPYIIFPGNVGDAATLRRLVERIM